MSGLVLVFSVLLMYFLPAIIAWHRRRPSAALILVLNATIGWTGIGWLLCLLLAASPAQATMRTQG
jgi:hypothetical protein